MLEADVSAGRSGHSHSHRLLVDVTSPNGEVVEVFELPESVFNVAVNGPLIHQVVVGQLATARQGTHSTKTRGEASGGGKKPYRQKGTGRARQGSTRAPQFAGGGVVHGPTPRSYRQRTPKKMKAAALRQVLSNRTRSGRLHVVTSVVEGSAISTREAVRTLAQIVDVKTTLVVHERGDEATRRSLQNVAGVHVLPADQLNTYDVIRSDSVVFTRPAIEAYIAHSLANIGSRRQFSGADDDPTLRRAERGGAAMTGYGYLNGDAMESSVLELGPEYFQIEPHVQHVGVAWSSTLQALEELPPLVEDLAEGENLAVITYAGSDPFSGSIPACLARLRGPSSAPVRFVRMEFRDATVTWDVLDPTSAAGRDSPQEPPRMGIMANEIDRDLLSALVRHTGTPSLSEHLSQISDELDRLSRVRRQAGSQPSRD
ncbi:50S ribosomal protein L4 [Aquipuribacter sp. MA13-6]|uniref:50S ribosomal protein L4 n=1 Tax=unclassified Aquipuribacter TaxID=2635084 RepID=UPI003EEDA39E